METPRNLRVTLVQTNLRWHSPKENRTHFEALIDEAVGATDLVVLPEMFTSGFTQAPQEIAEPLDGPTIQWMKAWARGADAALCGSLAAVDNGRFFNRFVFVQPDGAVTVYDKRHLFGFGGETERYAAGMERVLLTYRGWRIFPQVCYDLRFPVFSRNDLDYALAIYVANWPAPRSFAWRTLLRARAIENQCYVVGVNRIGRDANDLEYLGDSAAIDPLGATLIDLASAPEVRTATLDYESLIEFRRRFAFLNDRDRFCIDC